MSPAARPMPGTVGHRQDDLDANDLYRSCFYGAEFSPRLHGVPGGGLPVASRRVSRGPGAHAGEGLTEGGAQDMGTGYGRPASRARRLQPMRPTPSRAVYRSFGMTPSG